jgi:hypothetical protein
VADSNFARCGITDVIVITADEIYNKWLAETFVLLQVQFKFIRLKTGIKRFFLPKVATFNIKNSN